MNAVPYLFLISGKIFGVERNYLIAEAEYREGEGEEEDDVSWFLFCLKYFMLFKLFQCNIFSSSRKMEKKVLSSFRSSVCTVFVE